MSQMIGSAYGNNGEALAMALGNTRLDGAAVGNIVIWEQGSELYEIISIEPQQVTTNEPITITISANSKTKKVYLYNEYGGNVSYVLDSLIEQPDGSVLIAFKVALGSAGNRTITVYGTQWEGPTSEIANYLSVNYLTASFKVVSSS